MKIVLSIFVFLAILFSGGAYAFEKHEETAKDQFNQEIKYQYNKMEKESILKCQELSAYTTQANWTYKSCLKELKLNSPEVRAL